MYEKSNLTSKKISVYFNPGWENPYSLVITETNLDGSSKTSVIGGSYYTLEKAIDAASFFRPEIGDQYGIKVMEIK